MKSGTILRTTFERFEIIGLLNNGGSGDVYLARDSSGTEVAIKVLKPNQPTIKKLRFRNELSFCLENQHVNIIKVMDRGVVEIAGEDRPFYVMPRYQTTLRKYLTTDAQPHEKLEVFSRILNGVEAAHLKQIIHRDLKPENILMNPGTGEVVVADFGIAHFEEDMLATSVETSVGDRLANFEYAAPEQRRPGGTVDQRTDIYALGLMFNELFTRQVPHGADPLSIGSVAPEYAYLDEIANTMRQNSPERRPASIGQIKNALIARHIDFVQQQKLDELKRTVIPASEISDPLIDDPIKLVDVDYRNGQLIFTISRSPNIRWQQRFRNMGSYSSIMGSGPESFGFSGTTATVQVREDTAQMVVNHFKNYLHHTNQMYANEVRTQAQHEEQQMRRELQESLERETRERETRERIKSQLKW